jgi:hypothetical protein
MAVCARSRQKFYKEGSIVRWNCEHSATSRCGITRISIWHREQDLKTINGGRALPVHIPLGTSGGIGLIDECGGLRRKFEDEDEETQDREREQAFEPREGKFGENHVTQDIQCKGYTR